MTKSPVEKCVLTQTKEGPHATVASEVMLITFFDHYEPVHDEFVPQGQTVNQPFYKEVQTRHINKIRQKRTDFWARKTWILHHDNAPAHTALSVKVFGVKKITTLHHPPYSPALVPCDFFLFAKLKGILKGTCFKRVEDIKTSVMNHLKTITIEKFSQCFKAWSTRIEKRIKANGEYFKGDN